LNRRWSSKFANRVTTGTITLERTRILRNASELKCKGKRPMVPREKWFS
jgi:hypothetical protein